MRQVEAPIMASQRMPNWILEFTLSFVTAGKAWSKRRRSDLNDCAMASGSRLAALMVSGSEPGRRSEETLQPTETEWIVREFKGGS